MFDPARFLRLARAQWAEQWRGWAWFLGVCVILHFVALLLVVSGSEGFLALHLDNQSMLYFMGLFLTGPVFAGRYFQALAQRESAGVLLMRPASSFEKWLLALLVVLVAYPLAYSLAFQVLNLPGALYALGLKASAAAPDPNDPARVWWSMREYGVLWPWTAFAERGSFVMTALWMAIFMGFAVLGSLYFRALPFLKTLVVGFVAFLLLVFVVELFNGRPEQFFSWWTAEDRPGGWRAIFLPAAWLLVPGLLWLGALFALRERQVS